MMAHENEQGNKKIFITALLTLPEGKGEEFAKILAECEHASQQEDACIRYEAGQDKKQNGRFVLSEIWADEAGFKAHLAEPHFQTMEGKLKKLGGRLEVIEMRPLDSSRSS